MTNTTTGASNLFYLVRGEGKFLGAAIEATSPDGYGGDIVRGTVQRFELPNLLGLNFLLQDSLGGGGSASLKIDAQGKTHGLAMLRMEVEVPDDYEPRAGAMRDGEQR